jgi:hypothetical protein
MRRRASDPYQHAQIVFASSKDLQGMPRSQVDEVLNNIFRAMAFLEQPVEMF